MTSNTNEAPSLTVHVDEIRVSGRGPIRAHDMRTQLVPLTELYVDPAVQRPLNMRDVEKYAATYSPAAAGVIVVSLREGTNTYYVVDGQHRVYAAAKARDDYGVQVDHILAEVHVGLSEQEEATLFLLKNAERRKTSDLDHHNIGLVAGDPTAVAVERVFSSVRFNGQRIVAGGGSSTSIKQIRPCHKIVEEFENGESILRRALVVTGRALANPETGFPTSSTWTNSVFVAVAEVIGQNPNCDDEHLVSRMMLTGKDSKGWLGAARARQQRLAAMSGGTAGGDGSGSRPINIAVEIVVAYNNKLRSASRRLTVANRDVDGLDAID